MLTLLWEYWVIYDPADGKGLNLNCVFNVLLTWQLQLVFCDTANQSETRHCSLYIPCTIFPFILNAKLGISECHC